MPLTKAVAESLPLGEAALQLVWSTVLTDIPGALERFSISTVTGLDSQPLVLFIAITWYLPAGKPFTLAVVAKGALLPSANQRKEYAAVVPLTFAVTEPELALVHDSICWVTWALTIGRDTFELTDLLIIVSHPLMGSLISTEYDFAERLAAVLLIDMVSPDKR